MLPLNTPNSDFVAAIKDNSFNTCAIFSSLLGTSWYTYLILPRYYINKTEIVTVEFIGEDIGCSKGDDAKFCVFPISTWNDSTGLFGRREMGKFNESSIDVGTGHQKYITTSIF